MLRPDGYVKVLDFGVATLRAAARPGRPTRPRPSRRRTRPTRAWWSAPSPTCRPSRPAACRRWPVGLLQPRRRALRARHRPRAVCRTDHQRSAGRDSRARSAAAAPAGAQPAAAARMDHREGARERSRPALPEHRGPARRSAAPQGRARVRTATRPPRPRPTRPRGPPTSRSKSSSTEDSPEVEALARLSWVTAVFAAAGAGRARSSRCRITTSPRPGADLPLQLPEGAVLTKARDAIESLGYSGLGTAERSRLRTRTAMSKASRSWPAWPAAREAIREGVVAQWDVGLHALARSRQRARARRLLRSASTRAASWSASPRALAGPVDRGRARSRRRLGLRGVEERLWIDASGYQFEYIQRSFPAGAVEMTWRNPAPRFGHIEQFLVHLHGDRVVRLDR